MPNGIMQQLEGVFAGSLAKPYDFFDNARGAQMTGIKRRIWLAQVDGEPYEINVDGEQLDGILSKCKLGTPMRVTVETQPRQVRGQAEFSHRLTDYETASAAKAAA